MLSEGELRNKLQGLIDKYGLTDDFILEGVRKNPFPYYRNCDLYVHATGYEGKSIAIQEAQVLGKPVLATDCNGNREQIQHGIDGKHAGKGDGKAEDGNRNDYLQKEAGAVAFEREFLFAADKIFIAHGCLPHF